MKKNFAVLQAAALEELERILAELPEALRRRAEPLPVTFAPRPNAAHQRDGIELDTLGLFVGADFENEGMTAAPLPPQIILFLENIREQAEGDEELFRKEVRTTYLHELGHYLGLDEGDLFDRGLE